MTTLISIYRAEVEALKVENKQLRKWAASAQKCVEEKTEMVAELHNQRDEIERLRDIAIKLGTMCRAAAAEIDEYWDCHCDEQGLGPINLVSRLNGRLKPALYPMYQEDAAAAINSANNNEETI